MPPGVSKMHAKKRKISDESEERDSEEQLELSLVSGRQRRSAALKTHKVWDQLKPGAKPHLSVENEQEADENPSVPASTKRQRLTPKRGQRNSDTSNIKSEQQDNPPIQSTTDTTLDIKPSTDGEKQKDNTTQESPTNIQRVILSNKISSTRVFQHSQQQAMSQDQLDLIEREMEKHEFDEPEEEPLSDQDEEFDNHQESRMLLDDPNDEDYMDFPSVRAKRGRGGDSNTVTSGRGGRGRGGGARGGGVAGVTQVMRGDVKRGRPRGSRSGGTVATASGVMRGRINLRQPMNYYPPSTQSRQLSNGIYSLQPTGGGMIGELGASRPTGPPVVRVLRPAGMPLSTNFQSLRPASININLDNQQQQIAETNFTVNRELENYRNSIVAGSSVKEFNDTIDHLLSEYQRVVEDRSRLILSHREYVNHLKLTNQVAQDIKDNKIRQLEQTVEQLQQKIMSNFKHDQLRVVKQNTVPGAGDEKQQSDVSIQQPQQQGNEQHTDDHNDGVMPSPAVGQSHDTNSMASGNGKQQQSLASGGGANIHHVWPPHQGPRIRIMGMSGVAGTRGTAMPTRLLQPHHNPPLNANAPYFDDEMDDEEEDFDDEADSVEMDEELGAQVTI